MHSIVNGQFVHKMCLCWIRWARGGSQSSSFFFHDSTRSTTAWAEPFYGKGVIISEVFLDVHFFPLFISQGFWQAIHRTQQYSELQSTEDAATFYLQLPLWRMCASASDRASVLICSSALSSPLSTLYSPLSSTILICTEQGPPWLDRNP